MSTSCDRRLRRASCTSACAPASIVAEGVEQAVESEMLQVLGIALAQGYYFGAPAIPA